MRVRRWFGIIVLSTAAASARAADEIAPPEPLNAPVVQASLLTQTQPAPTTPPGGNANQAPVLPETEVVAEPTAQPPVLPQSVLQGTIFDSPPANGYLAESSTTGTIINMPDADVPFTVNVIPRAVLNDQQTLRMTDVIRNAGGTSVGANQFFVDQILLRGIELQSRDFRKDGFLDPTFTPRDFQNIERVEILKGPSSVLYGAGSPAGVVNLVTKKPVAGQFANFGFMFGSYNQARYMIDANGRANAAGTAAYRVNVAHEDIQSFRDFNFTSRTLVAPGVTWQVDDDTQITYLGEWHRDHRRGDQGMPALSGDPLALPRSRYVGEPANDFVHFEDIRNNLFMTHQFTDNWTGYLGGSSLFYSLPGSYSFAGAGTGLPPVPPPLFYRNRFNFLTDNEQSQSMIANLAGDYFDGLGFHHKTVAGMEYIYYNSAATFTAGTIAPIDVSAPVYTNPPPFFLIPSFTNYRQQRVGGYIQDVIDLTDRWKFMSGVRLDTVHFTYNRSIFGVPGANDQNFNRASPRAGLVFQPFADESLAFYGNYSQSFAPPGGGFYLNPGLLKPIIGNLYEGGVKTMLMDGLTFNAAGFYINRLNADLNTGTFFLTQVGEERSRGAELNLVGQVTDYWSLIGNYTYADVRLFDPFDPTLNNIRQRNVPYNTVNLWSRHNLLDNETHTLGTAIGLIYNGSRSGALGSTLALPSYTRWDAGLFYTRGPLNAALYAENVFDTRYVASSIDSFQVFPGAPGNVRATIGWAY